MFIRQRFENGGKPVTSLEKIGTTKKTGTLIHFKPDPTMFSTTTYNFETLSERLKRISLFVKRIKNRADR
jgi:topoisomerase-4 subunit B